MVIWNWPLDPTQRAQQLDAKLSNDQRFYLSNLALEAEKLNYSFIYRWRICARYSLGNCSI